MGLVYEVRIEEDFVLVIGAFRVVEVIYVRSFFVEEMR